VDSRSVREALEATLVIARILLIVVVWLGIFIAVFIGYFSIPLVVLTLFWLVYSALDVPRVWRNLFRRQG
jgi:ABC-type phosphate transport system permease subunit